jgi:azurin
VITHKKYGIAHDICGQKTKSLIYNLFVQNKKIKGEIVMNKFIKFSLALMAAILIVGSISPTLSAYAASSNVSESQQFNSNDQRAAQELQTAMQENNITDQDLINDINKNMGNDIVISNKSPMIVMQPRGIKSKAAKEAAKLMIKKLKSIGKKAWDKTIKKTVDGLPIPESGKKLILKYAGYKATMDTLNVVTGFSGDVENAIIYRLGQLGVPNWLGGIIARVFTLVLL